MQDGQGAVEIGLLGPVRVTRGDAPIDVRGELGRSVIARLALAWPHAVSEADLVAAVWEQPPVAPERSLRTAISRLRRSIGTAAVVREGGAFRLAGEVAVDVADARRVADQVGRTGGMAADAAAELAEVTRALGRWRGSALIDVGASTYFLGSRFELDEMRLDLQDRRCELLLQLGEFPSALVELAQLARAAPHRERTQMLLMRALAESGDLRGALSLAAEYRARWAELGRPVSKDFDAFERHVVASGALSGVAEPLPALGQVSSDLVGRARELADVRTMIAHRPVTTLVGPGGVGKTRLAIEAATGHPGLTAHIALLAGVAAPPAGSVGGSSGIAEALAEAFQLDRSGVEALDEVAAWLGSRDVVLVLDNCEHLMGVVQPVVTELTLRCPRLRVLATSRVPLGLANESVYQLGPLDTTNASGADPSPAVALLASRSAAAGYQLDLDAPGVGAAAQDVCSLLDGLPLAIELAAARLPLLGLDGMRAYIERGRVDVLAASDSGARHSSLAATVAWSKELVGDRARWLLPRLAVFPDWFTAEQVADVLGEPRPVDVLAELVETSFVVLRPGARTTRYRMLQPIKQALEQELDRAELAALHRAHAEWGLRLAARVRSLSEDNDLAGAQRLINTHVADLCEAFLWSHRTGLGDPSAISRACLFLAPLLFEHPHPRLHAVVSDVAGQSTDGRIAAAWLNLHAGNHAVAIALAKGALAELAPGEPRSALAAFPAILAFLMTGQLGDTLDYAERYAGPGSQPEYVRAGAIATAAFAHSYLGNLSAAAGLFDAHRDLFERCRTGGYADFVRAEIAMATDLPRSRFHSERGGQAAREDLSTTGATRARLQQLVIELKAGDALQAAALGLHVVPALIESGNVPTAWIALRHVAETFAIVGDIGRAATLMTRAHADPRCPKWPALGADQLASPRERHVADLWSVWAEVEQPLSELASSVAAAALAGV